MHVRVVATTACSSCTVPGSSSRRPCVATAAATKQAVAGVCRRMLNRGLARGWGGWRSTPPRLAVERLAAHADGRAHVPRGALGFLGRHRAQQFLQHRLCASGSTSSAKAFAPRRQAGRWYRARRASQRKTAESQAPASPRPQCGRWQIPPRPRARPLTIAQRVQSARRTGTQKQVVRTRKITCEVCSARLRLDPSWKVRLDHFLG